MSTEVIINTRFLKKILEYALAYCEYNCPQERDPETCIILVNLRKELNLPPPPCIEDYGGFSQETFEKLIKEIERRRGKNIQEILREFKLKGLKSLQDKIDSIDIEFALKVIKLYKTGKYRKILKEV